MNKQEWIADLVELKKRQNNIEGAIQYVVGKIQDIDRLEKIEKEKLKKEEK